YRERPADLVRVEYGRPSPIDRRGLRERTQQRVGVAALEFVRLRREVKLICHAEQADAGGEGLGMVNHRLQNGKAPGTSPHDDSPSGVDAASVCQKFG